MSAETKLVTEVPSSLKALARLVARGFYNIEDSLIIDMLVRNPCMKEDDICDLLKFEKKMLRSRMAVLKNDKFVQVRMKMETALDGKSQRMNFYYINYRSFVNIVKYKLDHIRRKIETEERDATSRASFKCPRCDKRYTDLEADQLFDFNTQEFRCMYCNSVVEEDDEANPKVDSRLLLSKFNDQMEPLYRLLREVEGVQLAPELLEPDPFDINTLKRSNTGSNNPTSEEGVWSGEATRNTGTGSEASVQVQFGAAAATNTVKEKPIWMVESTVLENENTEEKPDLSTTVSGNKEVSGKNEDIMSVLMAVEPQGGADVKPVIPGQENASDSEPEEVIDNEFNFMEQDDDVIAMDDSSDDEDPIPLVAVNGKRIPITDVTSELLASMTGKEKDDYIQAYQDFYHDNEAD